MPEDPLLLGPLRDGSRVSSRTRVSQSANGGSATLRDLEKPRETGLTIKAFSKRASCVVRDRPVGVAVLRAF